MIDPRIAEQIAGEQPHGPRDQPFPMGQYPPRRTLPPDLASVLWSARELSGLTNREVAERVGIDASYVSKLVRGTRCPSLVVAEQLVGVLGLSVREQEALRDAAIQDKGKSRAGR